MPFDPNKVSAPILQKVREMLEAEGIHAIHLLLAYDAMEPDPEAYILASHVWPQVEDHSNCHSYLAASALRAVGPEMSNGATGYMVSYMADGAVLVVPSSMGTYRNMGSGDGSDE